MPKGLKFDEILDKPINNLSKYFLYGHPSSVYYSIRYFITSAGYINHFVCNAPPNHCQLYSFFSSSHNSIPRWPPCHLPSNKLTHLFYTNHLHRSYLPISSSNTQEKKKQSHTHTRPLTSIYHPFRLSRTNFVFTISRNDMQTSIPSSPISNLSLRAATSAFIPPSWSDLSPLLNSSLLLWLALVSFAVIRSALYLYFHSKRFRRTVKERRRRRKPPGLIIKFARFSRKIRIWLSRNRVPETATAQYFGLPRFVAGSVVCFMYIINTYMQGIPWLNYVFQFLYGIVMGLNLLISFVYADRPVRFALSLKTFVECLSIPSLLLSNGGMWLNFNFLQAYCILTEWVTLEKHDIVLRNYSTMSRLLINLFMQLLTFLFVTSCGVQFFELLGDPGKALRSETFQITWANAVYFAVVTLMTVGYGDFVPYTLFGRMWIVFHIIFAAYLVSREISLLIDALKSMRRGGGSFINSSASDHIVVTGRIKWELLQQFVKEFLAESSNLDTRIVVLTSNPNWTEDEWNKFVAHDAFFDYHLMYLEGSALRMEDLGRASVNTARGVFVLAKPHGHDPYMEDSETLKAVLTIRNYSGTVPIYALNTLQESSFQFHIAMDHLDPINPDRLAHSLFQSYNPHDAPYNGYSQANISDYAIETPITQTIQDDPAASAVLGSGGNNLYSTEEALGGPAVSIDGNSVQGAHLPLKNVPRSKHNGQELKSANLCMQEIETVLLAENVFCNGLSTLLANAVLRVAPQPSKTDSPWLMEYKLGAECSILQVKIPKDLHEKKFGDIAITLQDYGLVFLAIKGRMQTDWTLLRVDAKLEAGMFAMVLSYHDHSVVKKILDHAAKFIQKAEAERRAEFTASSSSFVGPAHSLEMGQRRVKTAFDHFESDPEKESGMDGHTSRLVPVGGGGRRSNAGPSRRRLSTYESQPDISALSGKHSRRPRPSSKGPLPRSKSTYTSRNVRMLDPSGQSSSQAGSSSSARLRTKEGKRNRSTDEERMHSVHKKVVYTNVDTIPVVLRGHVIICIERENPLINLEGLLKRIWVSRTGLKKKPAVVVIHPRFPRNFGRQLGGDQKRLFLLQGNALSLETLKKAQYGSANAFLILASECSNAAGAGSTDSKAIFTVMTLDSLLADRDTFVCCVLDAEDSLQLLRAPRQPRRVGVNLGEMREPDMFNLERSPRSTIPKRSASSTSLIRALPRTALNSAFASSAKYGTMTSLWSTAGTARGGLQRQVDLRNRANLKGITRSESMRFQRDEDLDDDEDPPNSQVHALRKEHNSQQGSREEYYERQRYASGEMLISSLFTALLTRENSDPGYIRFVRQLIGSAPRSKGCWIRQVDIPESWTQIERSIQGRTYRQTCVKLLELGCIPLGLYRSGSAAVRVETKSEQLEGEIAVQWERRLTDGGAEVHYTGNDVVSDLNAARQDQSYIARWVHQDWFAHHTQGSGPIADVTGPANSNITMNLFSDNPGFDGDINDDPFERQSYTCPSTRRRIYFQEANNGGNVLPYVYCCPEPYSLVAASDAVFVLCPPETIIPANWGELD